MPPDDDVEILIASLPAAFRERFEIVERVGSGGTGIVYKGLDKALQRHFALKVLNPDQATDERILRLHREAKTLCQLKHPNIVSILDFIVTESGKPVLLMELVEGRSLEEIIDEDGPLPIEETVQILLQICQAISYAHAHSVLHRDLSPNNILVRTNKDGSHEIKVVDFGISKVETIQDRTIVKSGSLVGSVTVISPEQARGQSTDQRSDIYSFGCLAFKALSGSFPYQGSTLLEIVTKHINDEIPSLPEDCPVRLNTIVTKAMQKNPRDRFQSIQELREALEGIHSADADVQIPLKAKNESPSPMLIGAVILIAGISTLLNICLNSSQNNTPEVPSDVMISSKNDQKWLAPFGPNSKKFPTSIFSFLDHSPEYRRISLANVEKISDDQLRRLCKYKLEILDLRNSAVNDQSLEIISHCSSLKSIVLKDCKNITDKGIISLCRLKNLICLSLANTKLTDVALQKLLKTHDLRTLHTTNCRGVTDKSFPLLFSSPHLENLRLTGTTISRENARSLLNANKNFGYLGVGKLDLVDDDIPRFPPATLNRLDISGNPKLTSKTFDRIVGWKKLYFLNIENCTGISPEKIAECESNYEFNQLLLYPSKLVDLEDQDTESYFEPRLYELSNDDPKKIYKLMLRWTVSRHDQ